MHVHTVAGHKEEEASAQCHGGRNTDEGCTKTHR